jgi:hypothetical protein
MSPPLPLSKNILLEHRMILNSKILKRNDSTVDYKSFELVFIERNVTVCQVLSDGQE